MNTFFLAAKRDPIPLHNLLLSAQLTGGAFGVVFLFAFCFFLVHLLKYAKLGWSLRNTPLPDKKQPTDQAAKPSAPIKTESPPPPKEKAPAVQEPIYYIVERKRTRSKTKYGEPKEIRFQ